MPRLPPLLIVVAVWAAIYLPALGSFEIRGEEGRRILPAVSMLESGNYVVPQDTGTSAASLLLGGVLGVAAGGVFTAATYYGLLAIPTRHIFTVITVLVALLAAGMAAQAVQFLDAAGMIDVLGN